MSMLYEDIGVLIKLKEDDDFLKVKETLTRIGVASRRDNKLFQSCHILHKKGEYKIVHFKELFGLDGKETTISEADILRRNAISILLEQWELLEVIDDIEFDGPSSDVLQQIKILSFKDKKDWELTPKYNIGRR